ncbi:UvrD-helicase domain-containing protein [Bacillus sp. SCS-151]|uniref:UvrD-helicase domain-containing protein n=1 Tax=Nanhaiella sioensis TaxID=3115293 RepID=UPI00397BD98C
MNKVIQVFTRYLNKRKLNKYLKDINKHLSHIRIKDQLLEMEIKNLQMQREVITDDQIRVIENHYKEEYFYITKDKYYNLNEVIVSFFESQIDLIESSHKMSVVEKDFKYLRNSYLENYNRLYIVQEEVNKEIKHYYSLMGSFFNEVEHIKKDYIGSSLFNSVLYKQKETYLFYKDYMESIQDKNILHFINLYSNFENYIKKWNMEYIERELKKNEQLFNNIDGKSLDLQQRKAIVTNEDSNLIIAGAGSGKTLTISGKVKYLIEVKKVKAEEILLISFTNKASEEMYERISKKLCVDVDVKTFHKLGLEIISKEKGSRPDIIENPQDLINNYMFKEVYNNKEQVKKLIEFFGYYLNVPKNLDEFENLGEYHEHYKNIDFETLKSKMDKVKYINHKTQQLAQNLRTISGETVKSLEEFLIANFLFLNGIQYVYEKEYEYNTRDENYRQYKPDFYLPEYDLYLEHFGVNEQMRAPWLNSFEEREYIKGIHWKRSVHEKNKTKLIESFSYYNSKGILLEKLEENLKKQGVELKEVDFLEIFSSVYDQGKDRFLKEFIKLVGTFINLFKSNGFSVEKFEDFIKENETLRSKNLFLYKRTQLFFELVEPIFIYYQDTLKQKNEIDFNDMINMATNIVKDGEDYFPYKYIIIDEYQDISKSRFHLVNAIKEKTMAKVMCVGDDWQSIFRFAGSDLELFTSFEKYFGQNEITRIEKTYRNAQQLIDIAGDFVMKNPLQYKKDLKSDKQNEAPIKIIGYQKDKLEALTSAIENIVNLYGQEAEIMLLGRNNFDISFIDKSMVFTKHHDKQLGKMKVKYNKFPNLEISFLTVHRSKGLEAENVIIINAENSMVGFPNKIADDPLLSWVLTDSDNFVFAEERRLFYVALTRTKNDTYILSPEQKRSSFVKELQKDFNIEYQKPISEVSIIENPNCPRCQSGFMVKRTSNKGQFLGCTNYPKCNYTINNTAVINNQKKCGSCGSYMVKKNGRYGVFYGCTNFPKCENTENIGSSQYRKRAY